MKLSNEKLNLDNNLAKAESGSLSISPEEIRGVSTKDLATKIEEISNSNLSKEDKSIQLSQFVKELRRREELFKKGQEFLKMTSKESQDFFYNLPEKDKDFFQEILNQGQIEEFEQFKRLYEEKKIKLFEIVIGEKTKDQIQQELDERKKISDYSNSKQVSVSDTGQQLLDSPEFKINKEKKESKLIKLSVADLGFSEEAEFPEIIAKGKELGLELCPPEVGPLLRLNYEELMGHDQPKKEYITIAMDPISNFNGDPRVFGVNRNGYGNRCLGCYWADPDRHFDAVNDFLFVRK
jgi:hypothetical protein